MCTLFRAILSQLKHESELVAVSGGYCTGAMGMTPVARAQTHISKCRQISHAFFPPSRPFRPPTLPSPQIGEFFFFPCLVAGNVLIGAFPKLFLIKE